MQSPRYIKGNMRIAGYARRNCRLERQARCGLEALESRLLLSTFHVTDFGDSAAVNTLRWAIGQANSNAGADIIAFDKPGTVKLTSSLPVLTDMCR